jgi:hypothetical protein
MKTGALTISLITAFLAAPSLAKINLGKAYYNDGHVDFAAWIDGGDACSYAYLGHPNENTPCAFKHWVDSDFPNGGLPGQFKAPNGYKYFFSNCGQTNFDLLNEDYSFNSFAKSSVYKNAGVCGNGNGQYHVDQEWQF